MWVRNLRRNIENMRLLFIRSWKMSRSYCLVAAVKCVFDGCLPLINIIGLGSVIDALVGGEAFDRVIGIIAAYLTVNLAVAVTKEVIQLFENNLMRVVSNVMQFDYSEDSVNIDYHYVQDRSILDLRRKSMLAHPSTFLHHMGVFFNYIIRFIGVISILSALNPLFLILLAATCALSVVLIFKSRKNSFDFQNEKVGEDRKLDYLYTVMTSYRFAKEIRINNAEGYVSGKYAKVFLSQIDKLRVLFDKTFKIDLATAAIAVLQTVIMYLYFTYQVYSGNITIAEYTVLLSSATLLTSLLLGFFDNIAALGRVSDSVEFYREYRNLLDNHSVITKSNSADEVDIDFCNPTVKFENVSFAYPDTGRHVLRNIDFEIHKGEKIGIVGLNGSGKTTFIKLLTRVYDPTDGKITLNGIDIRDIPYKQYISHIGIVLQDFLLFAYSVKENIVLDRDFDGDKLATSIEKSGLTCKIDSLENGVDTSVYKTLDDKGIEFSGGEGQKLALARAVYKDAEMLILDEPTSALDPIAEYELFSKLNNISDGKTTVFISHRLSSTKFCDRIIVLSNGSIIECGGHDELMELNGFYADLFNSQAKYYKEAGVSVYE